MVISKRCKICTTLDSSNIPISGEYFGKQMPELILKLSGVELDPRKLSGVLLCQQCSIMLVHTEVVIDKLRKSIQRLKKIDKIAKTPKITSKGSLEVAAETSNKVTKMKSAKVNGDIAFRKIADDTQSLNGEPLIAENDKHRALSAKRKLPYAAEFNEPTNSVKVTKKSKRVLHSLDYCAESSLEDLDDSKFEDKQSMSYMFSNNESESNTTDRYISNVTKDDQSFKEKKSKDINCVLCGKIFSQKRSLREHIESCHMGEKLKECPNCFMEFRSVQKYESHVFSEKCKTTLHPCQSENCHRRFKNSYRMEEHMKEKHCSANVIEAD